MDGDEARMLAGRSGMIAQFVRTTRAIRQIMVLEQELVGLRPAPDRDAPPEPREAARGEGRGDGLVLRENLFDYDNGPMDQVVARIREVLAVAAPEDDPFAPAVRRTGGVSADGREDCGGEDCGGGRCDGASRADSDPEAAACAAPAPSRRLASRPASAGASFVGDGAVSA